MVAAFQVKRWSSRVVHLNPSLCQPIHCILQLISQFIVLGTARAAEQHSDFVVLQDMFARFWQIELPARRISPCNSCQHIEGGGQVCGTTSERATDGDVGLRVNSRQRVSRHNSVGGLVSENPAVVRGIADRRTNVAADLQSGES